MIRLAGIVPLLAMLNSLSNPCQPIRAVSPGKVLEYAYDIDGNRFSSSINGAVTKYLVDTNRDYAQVIEERDGSGALVVSYVYGDDLISQNRAGVVSYYHYDGIGSTRLLTDGTGTVTDRYAYEAFGEVLEKTGTTENNYLFTGEQYDPNLGFYYLRARYYDAGTGRFLTQDTYEGSPFDPASLHKYLYCGADPVNRIDPSGRQWVITFSAESAIMGMMMATTALAVLPALMKAGEALGVTALMSEAAVALTQLPQELVENASDELEEAFRRLIEEMKRLARLAPRQWVILLTTGPTRTPVRKYMSKWGTAFELGGYPYRVIGLDYKVRGSTTQYHAGRVDYQPRPDLFPGPYPGYPYTVHYHVGDMRIHHFVYPERRDVIGGP